MDNFKIIFKILSLLEKAMDYDCFDLERISPEALGISLNRRNAILKMLYDSGYIEGISVRNYTDGDIVLIVDNIKITLKGLEYLQENSLMKKADNIAKGITEIFS